MQIGREIELVITDLAYGGRGVGRSGGMVVFVPQALPGEAVRVRLTKQHAAFAEAELVAVLQPAAERIAPACSLAGVCPGCCYQHLDYAAEWQAKSRQLANLLERLAKLTALPLLPTCPAPQPLGYRNKLVLHIAKKGMPPRLGYFGSDNRTIIDVTVCPLAAPPINQKLTELRAGDFLQKADDTACLTLRWTEYDGIQSWVGDPDGRAPPLLEQTTIGGFLVPRGSFFQVNPAVADLLITAVQARLVEWQPAEFWDIYCGVGMFALAAARSGVPQVVGIDMDKNAVCAAGWNAQRFGVANAYFERDDATAGLRRLVQNRSRTGAVVLLDPPRTGLSRELVAVLSQNPLPYLIYISCAADTMARDLARLKQSEYRLESIQAFDMFPRTMHFECLACLRRDP